MGLYRAGIGYILCVKRMGMDDSRLLAIIKGAKPILGANTLVASVGFPFALFWYLAPSGIGAGKERIS
jgi:uncharacterized membrane protein